jgi:ABC-type branched-subunit amino acid transport system ATPase component
MIILETKNLTKRFDGVRAVDRLSIEIKKGKITSIIGPNGSGKTTLVNLLSGMLSIDKGAIMINGAQKLNKIQSYQISFYGITRTFQDVRLFEQMTVLDNILVVLTERNVSSSLFEKHQEYHLKKAEEVLQKIGLWEKRNQLAVNLSYGQRKLLEIARVLGMEAEIILFDEPFAVLFPEMVKIVSGIIEELKQKGKTIILIEHNMDLIRELSDHVFVMDEGKLLAGGKPNKVLEKREVVEAYLGE